MKSKSFIKNFLTLTIIALLLISLYESRSLGVPFIESTLTGKTYHPIILTFEDSVVTKIEKMQFKHPHIVLAQAKLESGHFSSKIFKQNNNMFGMKMPSRRPTVAVKSKSSYAYYNTWEESIIDLRIYYGMYLDKKSEKQVYQFLSKYYAQDPEYVNKLKVIIEKEKLKQKFNG